MTELIVKMGPDNGEIHPNWQHHWGEDIVDPDLKSALFNNPRLFDRIARDLMSSDIIVDEETETNSDLLMFLSTYDMGEKLLDVGLAWCSPRLVLCIFDKQTRDACGPLDEDKLSEILKFHEHASIDCVPVLPEPDEIATEGKKCLVAWLTGLPDLEAQKLKLQFDPEEIETIDFVEARAELFGRFIDFDMKRHGGFDA